jgi:pentose-5-phosphate-3-epimerase
MLKLLALLPPAMAQAEYVGIRHLNVEKATVLPSVTQQQNVGSMVLQERKHVLLMFVAPNTGRRTFITSLCLRLFRATNIDAKKIKIK